MRKEQVIPAMNSPPGRLHVSGNGRHLVDVQGRPFFYLADTSWYLFYKTTKDDAITYLKNHKEKGFTVITPIVLRGEPLAETHNAYGDAPLIDLDPMRPNEAFFEYVDWVIRTAAEMGFHLALLPTWGEYVGPLWTRDEPDPDFDPSQKGPILFDEASAYHYGQFLADRYRDRPIIWVLGGDRNPVLKAYRQVWRAMARGIQAAYGKPCLLTYHPCSIGSSSKWFHDEPWLDFNMMQTTTRWDLDNYNLILADYNRTPPKPTVDGEARYEDSYEWHFFWRRPWGRRITPHQVRKTAYNAMLSGAMGHTYGCRDVWYFFVPSDESPAKDVKTRWKEAMDLPGAFQMGYMKDLLQTYPWHELVPDQDGKIVVHGCGDAGTYTPTAASHDGNLALIYVPEQMPIWIDLAVLAGDQVDASWFNPRSGETHPVAVFDAAGVQRFDPPDEASHSDYLLILDADT